MSELGNHIYVGTGRNILVNILNALVPGLTLPALINPGPIDNQAEIWRFRKDGGMPWERVYKAPSDAGITGFRYMINDSPFGGSPCLYAAAFSQRVRILKSTNGINWFILNDSVLQGNSSRAMITHQGKLYVATLDELSTNPSPLLYSSRDPEFFPWEPIIDNTAPGFDPEKNPQGSITNMIVFNNRIYLATSQDTGVQVWRTNNPEPQLNDWTLVVGNGFGDPDNVYSLSMGVFKDHLYVSGTKELPLSWLLPRGCDIVRIDKNDNYRLVVGGKPLLAQSPQENGGFGGALIIGSGFNNPFNVYAWQMQEYQGKLLVSTFDDSSNMEVILNTLLANRQALEDLIGQTAALIVIGIYTGVVKLLRTIRYPVGFDLYISENGTDFSPLFLNGLNNPNNYGGRILFVDCFDDLYLGTANPFQGCEVWRTNRLDSYKFLSCSSHHLENLWKANQLLNEKESLIHQHMPAILSTLQNKLKTPADFNKE